MTVNSSLCCVDRTVKTWELKLRSGDVDIHVTDCDESRLLANNDPITRAFNDFLMMLSRHTSAPANRRLPLSSTSNRKLAALDAEADCKAAQKTALFKNSNYGKPGKRSRFSIITSVVFSELLPGCDNR